MRIQRPRPGLLSAWANMLPTYGAAQIQCQACVLCGVAGMCQWVWGLREAFAETNLGAQPRLL